MEVEGNKEEGEGGEMEMRKKVYVADVSGNSSS
jgi:hypothetical protein